VGSRRLAQWFGVGVALWGLPLALIPIFPQQAAVLALLACVGVGNALVDIGLFTLMARLAPDEVLGRVFGVLESLIALSVGLGALLTALLVDLFSVRTAPVVVGFCPILVVAARRLNAWTAYRCSGQKDRIAPARARGSRCCPRSTARARLEPSA
jgi:hypothetical protein